MTIHFSYPIEVFLIEKCVEKNKGATLYEQK